MITFIYYCLYHKSIESFQHDGETVTALEESSQAANLKS